MNPIRILLAEDHALVRAGVRALLQNNPDFAIVAEAEDGRQALALIGRHQPDVALMDISMPGMNGLEAASRIAKEFSKTRVLILSMHDHEEYVLQALQSGAAGYLLKDAGPDELEAAIRTVSKGETYLCSRVSRHVIAAYLGRLEGTAGKAENILNAYVHLTPRQREVLQLIAEGHTTNQIAEILHLSVKTIETHRSHLMKRLKIRHLAELVRYALRAGVISSNE